MTGRMMTRTSNYTEFDFHTDIRNLAQKIQDDRKEWFPDVVVGLTRGGLIPAVCLSHRLGVPMVAINTSSELVVHDVTSFPNLRSSYSNILVVDDMVDTGKQLKQLFSYWFGNHLAWWVRIFGNQESAIEEFPYDNIRVAVLINNTDVDKLFETTEGSIGCNYWARQLSRKINTDWISFFWEKQD